MGTPSTVGTKAKILSVYKNISGESRQQSAQQHLLQQQPQLLQGEQQQKQQQQQFPQHYRDLRVALSRGLQAS